MNGAAFMGRNGVINPLPRENIIDLGTYRIFPDAGQALTKLAQVGRYFICVVENEKYKPSMDIEGSVLAVHDIIRANVFGAMQFRYCPHSPAVKCECRLPGTQQIDILVGIYGFDLGDSLMIAGREREVKAAENAGIGHIVRVATGRGDWSDTSKLYPIYASISEAVDAILQEAVCAA